MPDEFVSPTKELLVNRRPSALASILVAVGVLLLTACGGTGAPGMGGAQGAQTSAVSEPAEDASTAAQDLPENAVAEPGAQVPSQNPVCSVMAASGIAELLGQGPEVVFDAQGTFDYAWCMVPASVDGYASTYVYSPDSQYAQQAGTSPGAMVEHEVDNATKQGETVVSTSDDGTVATMEIVAFDNSQVFLVVTERDGALVTVTLGAMPDAGIRLDQVTQAAAAIVAGLDIGQSLAYANSRG